MKHIHLVDDAGLDYFEPDVTGPPGQGGRLGFLSADAWLDEDGYHVWVAHDCKGERLITMLPWPVWQANDAREITPSFSCKRCATHAFLKVNRRLDAALAAWKEQRVGT